MPRKTLRILVLDDNEDRHGIFRRTLKNEDATHVYNFDEAIRVLTFEKKFDIAMLDHDLGTGNSEVADKVGLPYASGYDVAKFIAFDLTEDKRPGRVIIHSWNMIGASNMQAVLQTAGIEVQLKPFKA